MECLLFEVFNFAPRPFHPINNCFKISISLSCPTSLTWWMNFLKVKIKNVNKIQLIWFTSSDSINKNKRNKEKWIKYIQMQMSVCVYTHTLFHICINHYGRKVVFHFINTHFWLLWFHFLISPAWSAKWTKVRKIYTLFF